MMKHSEVREDFKSPTMKKVKEKLSVLKMSEADRIAYYSYLTEAVHSQDVLMAAEEKGEARGIEKGKAEEKIEIAKALLKQALIPEDIQQATGLSIEQIKSL